MVKLDPFCGRVSLQTGVKLVALVSFLWTLVLIIVEVVLLCQRGLAGVGVLNPEFADAVLVDGGGEHNVSSIHRSTNAGGSSSAVPRTVFSVPIADIGMSSIWIASWILDIVFSAILYQGARARNLLYCIVWFYFRCAALIFRIVFLGIYLLAGYTMVTKIPVLLLCIFRVYSLWAVNRFINHLQRERAMKAIPVPAVVVQYEDPDGNLHERKPSTQSDLDKAEAAAAATTTGKDEGHENPMFQKN